MMNILYEENNKRAVALDGNLEVGQCTYTEGDGFWIVDHTYVAESHRGQGLAQKLFKELIDQARAKEIKIMPLCSFAVKEFERNPSYADLLKK